MVAQKAYDHNRALQDTAALRGKFAQWSNYLPTNNLIVSNSAVFNSTVTITGVTLIAQSSVAFQGYPVVAKVDDTTNTVTQNTLSKFSNQWAINGNDPQVSTTYRLTIAGNGTWGATQQVLTFGISAFGVGVSIFNIGATELLASANFAFKAVYEVNVSAIGSSGAMRISCNVNLGQSANNQLTVGGTTNSAGGFVGWTGATTINTTANTNITAQAAWGSTTGAPTISSNYSIFERIGP